VGYHPPSSDRVTEAHAEVLAFHPLSNKRVTQVHVSSWRALANYEFIHMFCRRFPNDISYNSWADPLRTDVIVVDSGDVSASPGGRAADGIEVATASAPWSSCPR